MAISKTVKYNFFRARQTGAALIFFSLLLVIISSSIILTHLDGRQIKNERDKKTSAALAEAKAALIAYSLKLDIGTCTSLNCRRPGDLPCPDMNNNGEAGTACGSQNLRIGRFPWKTLGVTDLRDGDGERLWYALSNQYKNNPRVFPLNSDAMGTITVKTSQGLVINDGSLGTGVVAVIFAPGYPILRDDGLQQSRVSSNENSPEHYLDILLGEDNASFSDGTTDGFIMGPANDNSGGEIINDRLIVVTRQDMLQSMEALVLSKVKNALSIYYSNQSYFPNPANFNDEGCLGSSDIGAVSCISSVTNNPGRLPVDGHVPEWETESILRGEASGNWFQQNGWREFIMYAVAPACATGTINCNGTGMLQLNNAIQQPDTDKRVVLISSGKAIDMQTRTSNLEKGSLANYFEDENLSSTDGIFKRTIGTSQDINDRSISIQ